MKNLVSRFLRDESGATAIEYGLIAAGIAVVIIAAVQSVGSNLTTTFTSVAAAVK
ncbi:MAG: Flp family type IVb pilin [Rhizomicrobium sp.]|jgi:pilus assembly protein Flp/PilA